MNALDLMKGKMVKVMTDAKVELTLEIKEVTEKHNSIETGPSTRENDWWPDSRDWTTYWVEFTNGYHKEYSSLSEIKLD